MKIILALAATIAALASAATAHAIPNPYTTCPGLQPVECARGNARAIASPVAKQRLPQTETWVNFYCVPQPAVRDWNSKPRLWDCTWGSAKRGEAAVRFSATPNGWHATVTNVHAVR